MRLAIYFPPFVSASESCQSSYTRGDNSYEVDARSLENRSFNQPQSIEFM